MIKPIWAAVGGLALLGTAGGVGALVVASTGGEEEAAFEPKSTAVPATIAPSPVMDTPSPGADEAPEYQLDVPSFAPTRKCPSSGAETGTKTWRWGDVTVITSEGNGIRAGGLLHPYSQPVMAIFSEDDTSEQVMIDAFTGQLVSAGPDDDPVFEKREEIAPALNTVSICPFDPAAAPWPYTGAAPEGPRLTLGKLTFLQPDPSSGVQWSFQSADPGGLFLVLETARSEVAIDSATGNVSDVTARIHPDDKAAFDRYISTIELAGN